MPDPESPPPSSMAERAKRYPIGTPSATPSLGRAILDRIAGEGSLSFADFMALALYEPGLGYYAGGVGQIGRRGDYFTSVSVGPLFGALLARRFVREWIATGRPGRWRIIECGAHDGTLAADVLVGISGLDAAAFEALEYVISEPLESLRLSQQEKLGGFVEIVRWVNDPAELWNDVLPGIAFGNEVLDALPCHLVEWRGGRWLERRVGAAKDGCLIWESAQIVDPLLAAALELLGQAFPEGYTTEVRTGYRAFLEPIVRSLHEGVMIWIDYGFDRADYYHPGRTSGTLRTFAAHRAGEDPLERPGEVDITAHVDFTAVAEAAIGLGGQVRGFRNQGAWLTEVAREWLLAQDGNPDLPMLRQFQTLTHPGQLGGSFHVLELSWKPSAGSIQEFPQRVD